jgi:hypothetical protein
MRFLFSKVNDFLFIFDFILPIKKAQGLTMGFSIFGQCCLSSQP